jgi:hypothetical protein
MADKKKFKIVVAVTNAAGSAECSALRPSPESVGLMRLNRNLPVAKSKKSSLRRSMHRCNTTKLCRVCRLHGSETFNFLKRQFVFDVDKARRITQDGRKPVELDRDDVLHAVDTARIYVEHIPHVRLKHPGIVALMRVTGADGSVMEGDLLIDGHHRAAKCLQTGVPYRVFLLTFDETDAILKRRPDRVPAAARGSRGGKRRRMPKSAPRAANVAEKRRSVPHKRRGRRAAG